MEGTRAQRSASQAAMRWGVPDHALPDRAPPRATNRPPAAIRNGSSKLRFARMSGRSEKPRSLQSRPQERGLKYLDNQWNRLVVFLETPAIACHNNDTERDLRRPVKGKANFHYARSERGARAMAVYYSLFGTCLLQGINPHHYLLKILSRLDEPASALTPHAIRQRWESANTTK